MKSWSCILLCWIVVACSKKNATPSPTVSASDITQSRQDANSTFRFYFNVNMPAPGQISIGYATKNGSAMANTDYIPVSGSLIIQQGTSQGYVDVTVIGDSLRQAYQNFYLVLSDPVNCTLSSSSVMATIQNDGTYLPTDTTGYTSPLSYPGYTLIWSDEFNADTISSANWNFETGDGGWGNNELENYTSRAQNAFQSCGHLVIEARQETYNGSNYTSARMTTAALQQFQYGRIDIRAKLPVAQGMWPALWMLGANYSQVGWPTCGETDIMELIGTHPQEIFGTLHCMGAGGTPASAGGNYSVATGDFSQQFHVFSLIWKQDSLTMLVDDQPYFGANPQSFSGAAWPFNAPSFFIFNLAVGGNWPGPPAAATTFPQNMFVDYVRVFQ